MPGAGIVFRREVVQLTDIRRDTPVYPIGVVRRLTELSDRQIRYYEQVGLFQPARSPGKRRLFSQADVELLVRIKQAMERGLRTAEIREALGLGRGAPREGLSSPGRRRLPHFAGGEPTSDSDPDVEARRSRMIGRDPRRGNRTD